MLSLPKLPCGGFETGPPAACGSGSDGSIKPDGD